MPTLPPVKAAALVLSCVLLGSTLACSTKIEAPEPDPTSAAPSPTVPTESATPRPVRRLSLKQTAALPYFDVTVHERRRADNGVEGGGVYGARVTVCYTKAHPQANPDGTTRLSSTPWKFAFTHDLGVTWTPADRVPTGPWRPVYRPRLVKVGECNTGWVSVDLREPAFLANIGLRYAPSDFDFSATWWWGLRG